MRLQTIQRIESEKIVAIIRLDEQSKAESVVDTLISAGIKILEITSNTPGFCREIQNARERYPDVLIGAGTITNVKLAQEAINSGAQFIVTPNTNTDVALVAQRLDIPVLMGAMTPTEIAIAQECEADFIKLFPAGALGIDYFKAIRGPFNKAKFLAVGGINLSNALDWFRAGAVGVGLGESLTKANPEELNELTRDLFQYAEQKL